MDFAELDLTLEPLISQLVPPDFAIYRSEFPFGCARGACLTVAGQPDNTPPATTLELRSDNRSELARLLRRLKCNLKNFSDGALLSGVRFILFSGSAGIERIRTQGIWGFSAKLIFQSIRQPEEEL